MSEEMSEREIHDLVEVIGDPDVRPFHGAGPDYQRYLVEKALRIINPGWKGIHKKLGM